MERLNNKDNNCTVELKYCLEKIGREGVVLVTFEEGLSNRSNWNDVTKYLFSKDLVFIDLSTPEAVERNFDLLVEEIRRV